MYSRSTNRPKPPVRIPEHYSGVAFSQGFSEGDAPRFLEIGKPSPVPEGMPQAHEPPRQEAPHALLPIPVPKSATPLKGLDFDQLLILGLILLLWGNERDGDVVLWLALLLLWH